MDQICNAMRQAGITKPESQEGKEFCTGHCPYEEGCIVMEAPKQPGHTHPKATQARHLHSLGYSVPYISQVIGRSERTVQRYLAEEA